MSSSNAVPHADKALRRARMKERAILQNDVKQPYILDDRRKYAVIVKTSSTYSSRTLMASTNSSIRRKAFRTTTWTKRTCTILTTLEPCCKRKCASLRTSLITWGTAQIQRKHFTSLQATGTRPSVRTTFANLHEKFR